MNFLNIENPCPVQKVMQKFLGFKLFHDFACGFIRICLYGK